MKAFAACLIALAAVLAGCTPAPEHAAGEHRPVGGTGNGMTAADPWIRAMPAGGSVAAGYLDIANATGAEDRLLAVDSDHAARVEIHEMRHEDGMMRMRPLAQGLPLPANSITTLEPGGYHLMFVEPVRAFAVGDEVPATLRFEHAPDLEVTFRVRAADGGHEDQH